MQLITRKFFCLESNCPQRIFCERIGRVVAAYARQTIRLNDTLRLRRLRKQRKNLTLQQQRKFLQAKTTFKLPNARLVAQWLLKPLEQLNLEQQTFIKYVCDECPECRTLQNLAKSFQELIKQRQPANVLDEWLAQALGSQIMEMKNFAVGIQQDYSAVSAALKYEWSNGQVEGQINKLKLIKRQMYGRANLDLLKARMLYAV
nr:transposase [Planktothrix tepida]